MSPKIRNPYIAGPPVRGNAFFGRQDVFRFVNEALESPDQNAIVLYGQRRIGKTSILHELPHRLQGNPCTVFFDLMGKAGESLCAVLYELAQRIARATRITSPEWSVFISDYERVFRDEFLPQVYEALGERRLVLLFDEFDVLSGESLDEDTAEHELFPYLQDLPEDETRLAFVFVVGRCLEELPSNLGTVFPAALFQRISFLTREAAAAMIKQPLEKIIEYQEEAVGRILDWSAGHPYFTQLMCSELFRHLKETPTRVTPKDVDQVVDAAIERGAATFDWFWDGLPRDERVVLAAIARIVDEGSIAAERNIQDMLWGVGVRLPKREHINVLRRLVDWEILRRKDNGYRFGIEIIRRWVLEAYPIEKAQRDTEVKRLNPFTWERPVPPERFTGREKEARIVLERLTNPDNRGGSAVSGPQGVGKSSLLSYVASKEAADALELKLDTLHFVKIDGCSVAQSGEAGFWHHVLNRLAKILPGKLGTGAKGLVERRKYTPLDLEMFFDEVAKANRLVVLLLDNFGAIVESLDPRDPALLYNLRKLLNLPQRGLALVTASVKPTADLLRRLAWSGSSFDNLFAHVQLKAFTQDKVGQLIDRHLEGFSIAFNDQDRHFIYKRAQGHPQRTQHACYLLFERYVEKKSGPRMTRRKVTLDQADYEWAAKQLDRAETQSSEDDMVSTAPLPARSELPKADVLLVTATRVEALAVLDSVKEKCGHDYMVQRTDLVTYYDLGTIGGARTFMVRSGMGAGGSRGSILTVSDSISELAPSAVIMVGIAFGVDSKEQHI
jgi:hypothetical protein